MRKALSIRHIKAILKGLIVSCFFKIICRHFFTSGVALRLYSRSEVHVSHKSSLIFGKWVSIGKDSVISVQNTGKLSIYSHVGVSSNCRIVCHNQIEIGENSILGPNVMIYDHDHVYDHNGVKPRNFLTAPIKIGKNCWIGASAIILKGTVIGDNCVIAAGSIVHGTIPNNTLFVQKRETTMKEIN